MQVILFDLESALSKLSEWRKELWELTRIAIPDSDMESKSIVIFGFLTFWLISEVSCYGTSAANSVVACAVPVAHE